MVCAQTTLFWQLIILETGKKQTVARPGDILASMLLVQDILSSCSCCICYETSLLHDKIK